MIRWRPRNTLFLLLFLLLSLPRATAQPKAAVDVRELLHETPAETPANASRPGPEEWRQFAQRPAYFYKDSLERVIPPQPAPEPRRPSAFSRFFDYLADLLGGRLGITLVSLLLLSLVGYLIYSVVGPGGLARRRGKARPEPAAAEADEDLSSDWEQRMRRAEAEGALRVAVRCGYMRYLQLLQDSGQIRYRQDKTNADYAREITDEALHTAFRSMSRLYEFSWYGLYEPSRPAYEQFRQTIEQTKSRFPSA
jgi:hypothetical protein